MINIDKLEEIIDSIDFEKNISEFVDQLSKKDEILNKQYVRFDRLCDFAQFTDKVIEKYNSTEYRNRWFNRNIEPPEDLYWFLYFYVVKYGRKCNNDEWEKYSNMFSTNLIFYKGYYFNRIDGQGSLIKIIKNEKFKNEDFENNRKDLNSFKNDYALNKQIDGVNTWDDYLIFCNSNGYSLNEIDSRYEDMFLEYLKLINRQ